MTSKSKMCYLTKKWARWLIALGFYFLYSALCCLRKEAKVKEAKVKETKSGSNKKPYVAPQLTRHGSVTEITQFISSGSHGGPPPWTGGGGAPGGGPPPWAGGGGRR